MRNVLGFVVISFNQASKQPRLPIAGGLHATEEGAQAMLDTLAKQTAMVGRRETYRIAQVVLPDVED